MEWKNIYRGMLMGISDLIPGVSGGTIAFILGIYDRLLLSISGFFSRDWRRNLGFLLPLAIGIGIALLLFSRLIDYLLHYHYEPTQFFFIGLIVGVLPFIIRQAEVKKHFKAKHISAVILIAILMASLGFMKPNESNIITDITVLSAIGLFFSGWLGSMAMLLPGISGSFILLLLGVYSTVINALSNFNMPVIMIVGAGVVVGFIISSKAITYLLRTYAHMTFAVIMGLIIGSIFVIFPGAPAEAGTILLCCITFLAGIFITKLFTKHSK